MLTVEFFVFFGGVRILSETASCKLATPITVKFDDLRPGLGYDSKKESANFTPIWKGGEWHLRDITNYMTTAAFSLMKNASDNREKWLARFYEVGREAVRSRRKGEPLAYVVRYDNSLPALLTHAGVEFEEVIERKDGDLSWILLIKMQQPYAGFVKAIFEPQKYPDLRDDKNNPIPPYDVTAHDISLLYRLGSIETVYEMPQIATDGLSGPNDYGTCGKNGKITSVLVYRSYIPVIDEGWTRFMLNDHNWEKYNNTCSNLKVSELKNEAIKGNNLDFIVYNKELPPPPPPSKDLPYYRSPYKTILFPDQLPNQILNGFPKGSMPEEYTGGIGKDGVENLRKFVEAGGTLVFLNRASRFAIQQFDLPVRDVTENLPRKEFYITGSILRTELETTNPIARNMPKESIAWFEDSPAFEISKSRDTNVEVIARYPENPKDILLSGYALGAECIAGKAALVSINIGKGKVILFGFRPQYRGQSLATFPLLFNAVSEK